MRALAINGSPRKGGNTETLLTHVLEPLEASGWNTELVQVGGKGLRGCLACGKCKQNKNNQCSQTKDIFNEVMEKMLLADALILGSPTYMTDVTTDLKALLERSGFVALANDCAFAGKIGAAVVAGRRGGAIHVFDTINHMYLFSQMIVPGSNYWNIGRALDKGEVDNDKEGLVNMRNLGENIAWLGSAMKPLLKSFPKKFSHVQDDARAVRSQQPQPDPDNSGDPNLDMSRQV